jgi:small subunit ribosomal protein S16
MGAKSKPFYRVVVSDSREATTARAIEEIGTYDPRQSPPHVKIDQSRVAYWVSKGALLSDTVRQLTARAVS